MCYQNLVVIGTGGGATVRIRVGRKEKDAAHDGALPLRHDPLRRSIVVERLEQPAPVGDPKRFGHDRREPVSRIIQLAPGDWGGSLTGRTQSARDELPVQ
jgi:hypothetical protein